MLRRPEDLLVITSCTQILFFACLARIAESSPSNLRSHSCDINIGANDHWVISAPGKVSKSKHAVENIDIQLESHSLQSLGCAGHDLLPRGYRPGKGDLPNFRVVHEPGTEFVVSTQDLENSWREEFLRDLDHFERGIRGKWAESVSVQFENGDDGAYEGFAITVFPVHSAGAILLIDTITGPKSTMLAMRLISWIIRRTIPWTNASCDTNWNMFRIDSPIFFFQDFFRKPESRIDIDILKC